MPGDMAKRMVHYRQHAEFRANTKRKVEMFRRHLVHNKHTVLGRGSGQWAETMTFKIKKSTNLEEMWTMDQVLGKPNIRERWR